MSVVYLVIFYFVGIPLTRWMLEYTFNVSMYDIKRISKWLEYGCWMMLFLLLYIGFKDFSLGSGAFHPID